MPQHNPYALSPIHSRRPASWGGLLTGWLLAVSTVTAGPLILSDNFNAPNINNFDNSDQTGRRHGLLAEQVQLRSSGIQHGLFENQLDFLRHASSGSGRIRFHDTSNVTTTWWDFASGEAGALILADGGLRVTFEWTPPHNTSADWVAWKIGIADQSAGEPAIRVNHAETDFGILFRANGGTQYFDNGAATTGGDFDATEVTTHRAIIDLRFDSFDDGADVTVTASVDGIPVLEDFVFQWENNGGVIYMEWGCYLAGTRADNFTLSTLAPDGYTISLNNNTTEPTPFYSSVTAGNLIGLLTATNNDVAETSTFALVAGEGDLDNDKFQINGNRLEAKGTDLTALEEGALLSVRVQGTGGTPGLTATQVLTLRVIADSDSDQLPDVWELAQAGNLTDLNGAASGPGPGAGTGNFDGDSLSDLEEYVLTTTTYPNLSPLLADTDGDGLEDGSEITGAGSRPPTNPTLADTDGDGLSDGVESNTGVFANAGDTGTDPTLADTDGDYYQDDYEVERGSDPSDNASWPELPAGVRVVALTTDEDSDVDAVKIYTHTISGGYEAIINDVVFEHLGPAATPANFQWDSTANKSEIATETLDDWAPANGEVSGPGLLDLFGGFTYASTGAAPGSSQTFTLLDLLPGQGYEVRLYIRPWDKQGAGRPIDLRFQNGEHTTRVFLPMDRPEQVPPLTSADEAYFLAFPYVAESDSLVITAAVASGGVAASGSFHLYGLSNEEAAIEPPPTSTLAITQVAYQTDPVAVTLTFTSTAGKNYHIETATTLAPAGQPGGWSVLATIPAALGATTTYTDTSAAPTATTLFYRVREAAP